MKRLYALVLVLAMVASMIVMPTYAAEEQNPTMQVGYCQHCKEVIPEEKWVPWDVTNTSPRTGHYYLAADIPDQSLQINISLDDDLYRNRVCLDLRGRTYTVTGLRPFLLSGVLSVMDSVGGGEFAVTGASNAHGGFAMMGKGEGCKDGAGELNLYSGTIRRINTTTDLVSYGGLLILGDGATYNQYGGTMIGGEVVPHTIGTTNYAPRGGAIYAPNGNINICGGILTGGVSRSGELPMSGSTETQKFEGNGGNIYIASGELNISGGVVENGYADMYAGNIYASATNVNISGGIIRNGAAAGASGNIQFGGKATLTISGGYITGGACRTRGGNLYVNDSNASLNITGGKIDGDLSVGLFKTFTLSGAPKILLGNSNGLRLQSADAGDKLDISGLTEGAEIYFDGVDQVFTLPVEEAESYLGYFKDAIRADISVDESGALKVAQGNTGFCPHCWESGEQATWTAFDNSQPNAILSFTDQYHFYLTGTTSRTLLLDIKAGADLVLDMAGCTLTVTNYRFSNCAGHLSMMDSCGFGVITGTGHAGANGGVILGGGSGTEINMYSGTLSRSVKSGESTKRVFDGGVLYTMAGSQVNIYGGIIRGGIASIAYKNSPMAACGGNIYAAGNFNMTGGILLDGQAFSTMGYVSGTTDEPVKTDTLYVGSGGNLYVSGNATISGGHIIGGSAGYGGNVYATSGDLDITGGVIRDGVANDEVVPNDYGGNIYYISIKDGKIENALIRGGKTSRLGGNISISGSTVTITNALVAEGVAGIDKSNGCGGNMYINATGKLYLEETTVSSGNAYNVGGNIYGLSGSQIQMTGGILSGGTTATGHGGSVYATNFHMIGGRIVGGIATAGSGGNVYIEAGEANKVTVETGANGEAAVIANGTSGALGGNVFVNVKANGIFIGACIANGTGDTKNSSSVFNGDNLYGSENAKLTLTDCTIEGIKAGTVSGNGIYAGGPLTLKGNTFVTNPENKSCAYIGSTGKLVVDESFVGAISVAFQNVHFGDVEAPQGSALAAQDCATGVFSGTLLLEGYNGLDYSLPAIFAEPEDSKLYIAATAVVDPVNETTVWYKDNDTAAAMLTPSTYLRLHKVENTLNLKGNVTVDLNGNNLTVTGEGNIFGFDSKNDTYEAFGNMIAGEGVDVNQQYVAPNGRRYVAVETENGISFHRLGIAITGVSLRTAASGIYFKASWECDKVLQEKITSFGVAVSTNEMPGADFASDADTLYTAIAKESFVSGQPVTSAMIENIIKEGEDNQTRGTMPIYAAPYAVIGDLTIIGDDNAPTMGGVIYSLKSVLQGINRVWPKLTEVQQQSVRDLYAMDAEVFKTWDLYNITADVEGTASVRPLKVLTLGHSLAVDSGHMLNMIAATEGYDQPMEVATLYYSGCPLWKHVNFIKQNSAVYYLYLSSTTTPDAPPTITKGVTMEYGLEYDDWDIIIMQGGVFEIAHDATYTDGNIQFIQNYVNQHKTNPDAVFGWHMAWACPTDNELRDIYTSDKSFYTSYEVFDHDRRKMHAAVADCVGRNIVTDDSFIYLIPAGTAVENAVSSYLTEKDLYRDYVHVNDLGRVISSYTWYCTLAGIDHLDEIKLDAIPKAFLFSTADKTQDRVLTDMEKAIILESVNNALANPLQKTQSQYTVAP